MRHFIVQKKGGVIASAAKYFYRNKSLRPLYFIKSKLSAYGRRSAVCAIAVAFEAPTRGFSVASVTDSLFESVGYKHRNRVC